LGRKGTKAAAPIEKKKTSLTVKRKKEKKNAFRSLGKKEGGLKMQKRKKQALIVGEKRKWPTAPRKGDA